MKRNLLIILALVVGVSLVVIPTSAWALSVELNQQEYAIRATTQDVEPATEGGILPEAFPLGEGYDGSQITGLYHAVDAKEIHGLDMMINALGPLQVPLEDGTVVTVTDIEPYTILGFIPWGYTVHYTDTDGEKRKMHSSEFEDKWVENHLYGRADAKMSLDIDVITQNGERIDLGQEKLQEISEMINEYSIVLSYSKDNIEWDNIGILLSSEYDPVTGNINIQMTAANIDILKLAFGLFSFHIKSYLEDFVKDTGTNLIFGFKALPQWEDEVESIINPPLNIY